MCVCVCGFPLSIAAQDALCAFDNMNHECIASPLTQMGVSRDVVAAISQVLEGVRGKFTVPGAVGTEHFDFRKGGNHSDVEIPDTWNAMAECSLNFARAGGAAGGWIRGSVTRAI